MKARKKILVAGIIATLLLSTMGIGVYAGTVGENETVNLEKPADESMRQDGQYIYVSQDGGGDGQSAQSPAKLSSELIKSLNTKTNIVITSDIELTQNIIIEKGQDVTLLNDGNARTINIKNQGANNNHGAFQINKGAKLTIATSQSDRDDLLIIDGSAAACASSMAVENCDYGDLITCRGTLTLSGGTLQNSHCTQPGGGAVVVSGNDAEFDMTGGTIRDNTFNNQYGGTVRIAFGAKFEMNGGAICENETKLPSGGAINNAAVYVEAAGNSSFYMKGGQITGNYGDSGGVFIGEPAPSDFSSVATMEMNGGSISGNTADKYGGGIMVCGQARVTVNKGEISGNTAIIGGGVAVYDLYTDRGMGQDYDQWKNFFPAEFTMNYGVVSGNKAVYRASEGDGGCGGGIYVASDNVVLKAGVIENNQAERQGGGIYVGSVPYTLHMYDAVITENTAELLGGGLWFCPTGDATNTVTNGGAIYGNKAGENGAGDDFVSVPREGKGHYVMLADRMLGGGEVKWYKDGGVLDGAASGTNVLGLPDGSARYDKDNPGERIQHINMKEEGFALKAEVTEAGIKLAQSQAKLTVTGNSSARGGGIGSNGGIVIGTPDEWTLNIKKVWDVEDEKDSEPVNIYLKIGEHLLDHVTLNEGNGWQASFTQLPNPESLNNVSITVVEENGQHYQASYSDMQIDKDNKTMFITVTNKAPLKLGNLKVTKTVTGDLSDSQDRFPIQIKLSDDSIEGTFGDMVFEKGVALIELSHGESAIAEGLPAGIEYTVTETDTQGYKVTYKNTEGIIVEDETALAEVINDKTSVKKDDEDKTPEEPEDTAPKTGDSGNLNLYIAIMTATAVGAAMFHRKERKTQMR